MKSDPIDRGSNPCQPPIPNPQFPVPTTHFPIPSSCYPLPLGGLRGTHCENKSLTDWVRKAKSNDTPDFAPACPLVSLSGRCPASTLIYRNGTESLPGATAQWPLNAAHTRSQFLSEYYFCFFFSFLFITELCLPRILWSLLIWVLSTLWWHGCSSTLAQA